MKSIGLDAGLTNYADKYLTYGGPRGVLKFRNRALTDEEAEAIQQAWKKRYEVGGRGDGGVAVLDEDSEYQAIGSHLKDLEASELKQYEQAAVCSAFGVPPVLVGAFVGLRWSNQRAGQQSAQKEFWANKVTPTLRRYRGVFERQLLAQYEAPRDVPTVFQIGWDLSQVAALQEDVNDIAERTRADYKAGVISRNEARAVQLPRRQRAHPAALSVRALRRDARRPHGDEAQRRRDCGGERAGRPRLRRRDV